MSKSDEYYSQTFSQREGIEPLPEPMRLGRLSKTFRNAAWLCIDKAIALFGPSNIPGFPDLYRESPISNFIIYYIGKIFDNPHDEIINGMQEHRTFLKQLITQDNYDSVLTFIELFLRYTFREPIMFQSQEELRGLFERMPVAYVVETLQSLPTIVSRSSPESGTATTLAIKTVEEEGPEGAKVHLREAAENITAQRYADSVRESIHAVESVVRTIDPRANAKLGSALTSLEKAGVLKHGLFKKALEKLYGYTNSEEGIRHPLLDEGAADVDLDDAVFMFSTCAAFSAYLLNRHRQIT